MSIPSSCTEQISMVIYVSLLSSNQVQAKYSQDNWKNPSLMHCLGFAQQPPVISPFQLGGMLHLIVSMSIVIN